MRLRDILSLVMAMCLAGSSVVVGKVLAESLPIFLATFATLLVALACLLPLLQVRRGLAVLYLLSWRQWQNLFLQALCGIVLFRLFTMYGLRYTSASQAGIVTGLTPVVLALLSWLFLRERLTGFAFLGVGLAATGCLLVNQAASEQGEIMQSLLGGSLVFVAVVCEALFTIFRKKVANEIDALTNTTGLLLCSLALLLIPALLELTELHHLPTTAELLAILYYGVFATVCAYLLWTSAVGRVSGAVAGAATAWMPASAFLLAVLLLGEEICWQQALGCLLVLSSMVTMSYRPARGGSIIPAAGRKNR